MEPSPRPMVPMEHLLEAEDGANRPVEAGNKTSNEIKMGKP